MMNNPTAERKRGPMVTRIFVREDIFYMLDLPDDDDLSAHAESNPGTLRIEDVVGNVLWSLQ
jgi:hypothetical protein